MDQNDDEIVREVVEIVANFLRGNICIPNKKIQNIRYHSTKLRKLAKTKSYKNAKIILSQTGGWANILVPPLIAIGGSCVRKLLDEVHK